MAEKKLQDTDVSAIDRALAAAKARKEAKGNGGKAEATGPSTTEAAAKEPKRPRLSDEEKAARQAARDAERAERKAKREAERAQKLAERQANRQPAHMKKVQKAAEKLGELGQAAQLLLNEATTNLTAAELAALALHIQHFNRVKATERALGQKIEAGMKVTIVGGDPRFIGKTGTVSKAQRIRCYVAIEGQSKPVYLFTSDVAAAQVDAEAETQTAANA